MKENNCDWYKAKSKSAQCKLLSPYFAHRDQKIKNSFRKISLLN